MLGLQYGVQSQPNERPFYYGTLLYILLRDGEEYESENIIDNVQVDGETIYSQNKNIHKSLMLQRERLSANKAI
jgi:hypothetical protein